MIIVVEVLMWWWWQCCDDDSGGGESGESPTVIMVKFKCINFLHHFVFHYYSL